MRGAFLLAGWIMTTTGAAVAAEIEPLDAEFLEYLAEFEADDDDWTFLAEADQKQTLRSDEKPATEAKPIKTTKEAAKPAADER